MAAVPMEVLAEPPAERTPWMAPRAWRSWTTAAAPRHIASMAAPRSPRRRRALMSAPPPRGTPSREGSGRPVGARPQSVDVGASPARHLVAGGVGPEGRLAEDACVDDPGADSRGLEDLL